MILFAVWLKIFYILLHEIQNQRGKNEENFSREPENRIPGCIEMKYYVIVFFCILAI